LVAGEVADDGHCGGAISRKKFLVCLKKTPIVEKILEVVVVEGVWGRRVKVVQSVSASILWTILLQGC